MKPLIVYSEMTGRWYVATRYKILDDKGNIEARLKYDVTDQVELILKFRKWPSKK